MSILECTPSSQAEITVGEEITLTCSGEVPPEIHPEKMEIRLSEQDKYKIQFLAAERVSGSQLVIKVTSYKTGKHELKALQVVDDLNSFVLGDLNLTVKSVMNPMEPKEEPYGPTGPFPLGLEWYYFAGLGLLVSLTVAYVSYRIWRHKQLIRFLGEIHHFETKQTPYNQFHQSLRKFLKSAHLDSAELNKEQKLEAIQELNKIYRTYVSREFLVPALKWVDRRSLRYIRKQKFHDKERALQSIKTIFRELATLLRSKNNLQVKDIDKLQEILRKSVDLVESCRRARNEGEVR